MLVPLFTQILLVILANLISITGVNSSAKFTFVNECSYQAHIVQRWNLAATNHWCSYQPLVSLYRPASPKTSTRPRLGEAVSGAGPNAPPTHPANSPAPPAIAAPGRSSAEFTLDGSDRKDFYDVSLVDGYNLPVGGDNCSNTGCLVDLNGPCPSEMRVRVACKSACEAFDEDRYCCRGAYGTPDACKPMQYSQLFKNTCPHAYSYAYDDAYARTR